MILYYFLLFLYKEEINPDNKCSIKMKADLQIKSSKFHIQFHGTHTFYFYEY